MVEIIYVGQAGLGQAFCVTVMKLGWIVSGMNGTLSDVRPVILWPANVIIFITSKLFFAFSIHVISKV